MTPPNTPISQHLCTVGGSWGRGCHAGPCRPYMATAEGAPGPGPHTQAQNRHSCQRPGGVGDTGQAHGPAGSGGRGAGHRGGVKPGSPASINQLVGHAGGTPEGNEGEGLAGRGVQLHPGSVSSPGVRGAASPASPCAAGLLGPPHLKWGTVGASGWAPVPSQVTTAHMSSLRPSLCPQCCGPQTHLCLGGSLAHSRSPEVLPPPLSPLPSAHLVLPA